MLVIRDLEKIYQGTTKGISGVSLHVEKGDIYAFIGHNGAGKTTLLKAITGIHPYDKGEVVIDGIDLQKDPIEVKRRIAYVPDNPDIYDFMTGIQYLNFIADVFGVPANEREARIADYAERFEITSSLGDLISSYSHGMKQKLVLISALLHEPKLLIMDEPFVGLDPKAAFLLKEIMKELTERGGAIFFSTHVLEVAEKLCNKVAIIKEGRLVTSGLMSEVVSDKTSLEAIFMETVDQTTASAKE
ncbi:MAG: ABC transporter ATP-binding protein [Lachnospiraceae bacterium]|nr:ABC transporter ATP-binding protein [Lachnospiraceae bacterium]MBO7338561.1 ABC transporter ATP-binding protein [Lachnospiraceae bacterium]